MAQQKKPNELPSHQAKEIPISEALEQIGYSMFGKEWTGQELQPEYFQIFYWFRGRLDDPEVKEFLQIDLNDKSKVRKHQKPPTDFLGSALSPRGIKRKSERVLFDMKGGLISRWPQKLTSEKMARTYNRFREAWGDTLLAALRDGSLEAYQLFRDGKKEKLIPRSQWRSFHFEYDLLSSRIFERVGHAEDDYIFSDCFLPREAIRSFLVKLYAEKPELPRRGRPSIEPQLIQQLNVRARNKDIKPDVGKEADALCVWAREELVPEKKGIENIIRQEHARLVVALKSRGK